MRMTYKALTFALALVLTTPVMAQENAALLRFAANNDLFDQRISETAKDFFRRQVDACPSAPDRAVRQLPKGFGTITFPSALENTFPAPVSGIWLEHVKLRACNKIWQVNMLAVARSSLPPLLFALLPGDTNADPSAQRSAERIGATAIKKADDSCADNPKAKNTQILGFKQADGSVGKTDAQQGWFEQWDYKYCQKSVPVQLAFTPDGSGGFEIKARLAAASETPQPGAKPLAIAPAPAPAGNAATTAPAPTAD